MRLAPLLPVAGLVSEGDMGMHRYRARRHPRCLVKNGAGYLAEQQLGDIGQAVFDRECEIGEAFGLAIDHMDGRPPGSLRTSHCFAS